jgi:hypothetical protein
MRKEGWEPYPFKIKYLIPLFIYLIGILGAIGYEMSHTPRSIANLIGIGIFLTVFLIQYIVGVRKIFADLVLKLNRLNFYPLLTWIIGSAIVTIIEFIFFPQVRSFSELIYSFIFMAFASLFYCWGMIMVFRDIKDISI